MTYKARDVCITTEIQKKWKSYEKKLNVDLYNPKLYKLIELIAHCLCCNNTLLLLLFHSSLFSF